MKPLEELFTSALHKAVTQAVAQHIAREVKGAGLLLSEQQLADLENQIEKGGVDSIAFDLSEDQEIALRASNAGQIPETLYLRGDALADLEKRLESAITATVERVASDAAELLLATWKAAANATLSDYRKSHSEFEQVIYQKWRRAIDLLEMIIAISAEAGEDFLEEFRSEYESGADQELIASVALHIRGCQVAREVLVLLTAGLPDGALSRWRTLHELAVTAFFVSMHGASMAQRFLEHTVIQEYRAAQRHQKHFKSIGLHPISEKVMTGLKQRRDAVIEKYGVDYAEEYGWAAEAFLVLKSNAKGKRRRIMFSDIETQVDLEHARPYVGTASENVHAGSVGTIYRLSASLAGYSDSGR